MDYLPVESKGKPVDGHLATCGICERLRSVAHVKNYNYLGYDERFFGEPVKGLSVIKPKKPSRNKPCSCGSGIKYKKCCGIPARFSENSNNNKS